MRGKGEGQKEKKKLLEQTATQRDRETERESLDNSSFYFSAYKKKVLRRWSFLGSCKEEYIPTINYNKTNFIL